MKKAIWITAICVLAAMLFAACSNSADEDIAVNESETVSSSAGIVSSDETVTESAEFSTDTAEQNSAGIQQNTSGSSTNDMPNETVARREGTNTTTETTKKRQTNTQKQTTAKRQTTTQKPATTKKTTTKKPTTTKKSGVSQSDVQWVQAQAHAYMRSKGIVVDSGVGSYSGRISSVNRTKEELLDEVREWIDGEYNDCKASGYDTVYMYCKIESRGNGSYFLYVMYG